MKTIGIKLADGSFYPVLEEGTPKQKNLELTTAHNNQTKVMVDLYRSASCTMEDAEYVDSLQIENLNAHPTGETEISFTVALDEDNQLSANILDEETGKESGTTITLVSRTLEERLVTDEYKLADYGIAPKKTGGLLAAASRLREADGVENELGEPDIEETAVEDQSFTDFNLGDPDAVTTSEDDLDDVLGDSAQPAFEQEPFTAEDFNLDEESETPAEETPVEEEAAVEETQAADDFEIPTEESAEPALEESGFVSDDLPDFNLDNLEPTPETTEENTELPDFDVSNDLPDFDFDQTEISEATVESDDLPDFNFDEAETTESTDFDVSNDSSDFNFDEFEASEENNKIEESNTDSFDLPDFGDLSTDTSFSEEDNLFSDNSNDDIPTSGGISFTGLYDKETELGESSNYEEEDTSKKTRVPVIICIICAIICVIATLLVLFIIPSKYNLLTKKADKEQAVEVVQNEPEPVVEETYEPEPEPIPEAKEDEIVIVEKAEEVVPEQPPVVEEKPKNITYKIKWGDTLWDISNTYYKNPWRYKDIARFNKIKDPDYIISGTLIEIPAE